MARMIDAEKAMKIVREECVGFMTDSEIFTQADLSLLSLNKVINTRIKALPYTDAEPVVRCKDCKWYGGIEDEEGNVYPTCEHPEEGGGWPRGKDWFCADGERRDDG